MNIPTMETQVLASAETIAAGDSYESSVFALKNLQGYAGLSLAVSGSGTLKVTLKVSNSRSGTFVEPTAIGSNGATSLGVLFSGLTASSGPAGDGNILEDINLPFAMYGKLVFEETGGANSVTVTAELVTR